MEPKSQPWSKLKYQIFNFLVDEKKISFNELIHQHHCMHVERVSRFLNILSRELSYNNMPDQVKDWFQQEIKFTK